MAFENAMNAIKTYFPGTILEGEFVQQTHRLLADYGFTAETTIASVGVCRDELTRSLLDKVHTRWGEAFSFSALGGMILLGKTGFLAATHHSPNSDGRERYLYIVMPHIGIGEDGTQGLCYRPGRKKPSNACGALVAFQQELMSAQVDLQTTHAPPSAWLALMSGKVNLQIDPLDLEQSLLKQKLSPKIKSGDVPDLVTLTKIAHDVILEDLQRMIALTTDPAMSDIAVLSGIQIHGADGQNYVCPGTLYVVVDGKKQFISL